MNVHASTTASLAPNPQFRREGWVDLCGVWGFAHDDEDEGLAENWARGEGGFGQEITVPFPPESRASGIAATGFHPIVWYRRSFEAPKLETGERLLLNFGAVDYAATVWVNGQCVATHEGGHTPFSADITHALTGSGAQTIVLRAEDQPEDVRIPRGKQDWLENPHAIWYYRTTGIWQPVWLSVVPELFITDIHFVPDIANARVRCEVRLNRPPAEPTRLSITARLKGEVLAEQSIRIADSEIAFDIAIPALEHGTYRDHLLWTPERPNLVDADIVLEGARPDRVESYFGLRSVGVGSGHFLLNGLPYYLRLVLGQNYWPESHLAAPSPDALRREAELVKAMGFNGLRIHQKIEDPRFLYWCDVLGLIVWEEMPSAYAFSNSSIERLSREWMEAIRRDKSHPSIVAWVPLNESWGVTQIAQRKDQEHLASALYHLTKALDPSRPAISNDGWELVESDIWSVHDYAPDGEGLRSRFHTSEDVEAMLHGMGPARRRVVLGGRDLGDKPMMLTEFGGLSFTPRHGEAWHGYSTVADADAFEERLRDIFGTVAESPLIAGYCYTQLTDTEQETNGLLTAAREPKLPLETINEIMTLPAASVPYERIDRARTIARKAAGTE
ncbi:glycoside hydrolase family 2 [Arsenicitalea aurantiaca]|uniref:Glycoside hydrolase family 2 n=1 Tax=Arsenicitalea aurantiaca TaxID=1783274 RepID=A0A433X482_9HYPH|nr:sugar-binding domain-containing protein [Arsenicitalea aurantiaca]RUT28875.1 glycoside hydrolase family 2 [Arsenicitalea aurantiaca]